MIMDIGRFSRKIKVTMYSRFEGHRRLKAKANTSLLMFILFSIIVIAGSLILLVYSDKVDPELQKFVSLALIIFSVNSLAFQLFEYSQQYEVRSHNMFMSGTKLAELRNKFDAHYSEVTPEIHEEYERILRSHFENHEPVDFHNAKIWVDKLPKKKINGIFFTSILNDFPPCFTLF